MWPTYLRPYASLHPDSRNFICLFKPTTLVSVMAHELAPGQRRDMLLHLRSEVMLVALAAIHFRMQALVSLSRSRNLSAWAVTLDEQGEQHLRKAQKKPSSLEPPAPLPGPPPLPPKPPGLQ